MRTEAVDRVRLVFTLFDVDGNGFLEPDDFELMTGNVVAAAPGASTAAVTAIRTAFENWWQTLAAELDANRDGRISYDEFQACVLDPDRFDAAIDRFALALTALGDPDGDGRVERPLFLDLMLAIGFAEANTHALFDAMQPDAGDAVRAGTWAQAIRDYYHPDVAATPGNRLVG
jgi:hypothetical protein